MDNSIECAISIYAALLSGAAFLVVNPQTKADKLAFILEDSGAAALLTEGRLGAAFLPALVEAKGLRSVICAGGMPAEADGLPRRIESLGEALRRAEPSSGAPSAIPNDLAALIYTSGSTGNPKGVMMSHQSMVFTAGSLIQYLRLGADDRILDVLPLAFDYGLYQLLMSVYLGATLILERSFVYPAQVLQRVRREGATVFPGVPTLFSLLIGMHRKAPLRIPSILRVTNTAAGLPADYNRYLHEIFPNALIYRMYGLTECKRVCYLEPELADVKPESVGKAIPGTEAFILSPEGLPAAPGERGILHVRGPHVMLGYWKQPELTKKMLKDGPLPGEKILCTQDWFTMDEDGFLYFKGRSDDVIKTRGEKVSPVEVENALYGIPGIREAAVIGVPDELLGQAVKALVVADDGLDLTEVDIRRHCTRVLENFMVPKYVEFRSALPKTDTGKIKKAGLR
jgi:acyl-CoA synthetase (AMP-forming)/AMP-acid ligase II